MVSSDGLISGTIELDTQTYRLQLSYTRAEDSAVPRQGLYLSFVLSCEEYGIESMSSACFGRAVRAAYPGIKTRRLGPRHYRCVSLTRFVADTLTASISTCHCHQP